MTNSNSNFSTSQKPRRIIFTVTNDLTYDRRMLRICTSLATAGFDICLVGRKLPSSQPFDNQHITSHRLRLFFQKGKLFYIEYNLRLFFWLLVQRFDIVCAIDLDTILPCLFVKILRGGEIVYDAHELFSETPEVVRRPAIRRVWLAVEKFTLSKISHRYTVSQSIADEFFRRYKTPFEVIKNLPNRSIASDSKRVSRSDASSYVILYQGALNEGRGLETAISAMRYIDAEFWLVGEGDLSDILRGQVADQNLTAKVKFLGFVPPAQLSEITEQADIGLLILEDKGLSYRYSLANKFFDYIQAEVPQIFTQLPEYQRFNAEFNVGLMIPNTDETVFVEAVNRLLNDADLYKTLKENCRRAAEILCWENEERKLIDYYKKIATI